MHDSREPQHIHITHHFDERVLELLHHFSHQLINRIENIMTVHTDALVAKITPLKDAVTGLVTIVANIPALVGDAVRTALAEADVQDTEAQVQVDAATAAAQEVTDQALAAAQLNTGTTLPPPAEVPPV